MELLPQHLIKRATNIELSIGALSAITEIRQHLVRLEREAIEAAREKGASWRDIADALGVTRQALQQRVARYRGVTPIKARAPRAPRAAGGASATPGS